MHLARQLFVPAFLTLLVLGIVLFCFGPDAAPAAAPAAAETAAEVHAAEGLAIGLPDQLLRQLEAASPAWARLIALIALLAAGTAVGRISVRSNLYGVNTCLAIPLCGILVCLLAGGQPALPGIVAILCYAFALKRFGEALRDGYSFDALFRGSFQLGLLVLVEPAALPLLLLLPFGVLLFQRTRRETVVALAGILLGPALWGYLNWSFGGSFTAPSEAIWAHFAAGEPLACFRHGFAPWMAVAAAVALLDLGSIASISANVYSVGARARYLLLFHTGALLLTAALLAGPGAEPADALLLAVPSAVLLPFLFVRVHATLSSLFYLLLLAAALVRIFLPVA